MIRDFLELGSSGQGVSGSTGHPPGLMCKGRLYMLCWRYYQVLSNS